jgi:hypothetical protein
MNPRKIVFIVMLLIAFVLWLTSISMAVKSGFFENELALQLMILGGAVAMVGGAVVAPW